MLPLVAMRTEPIEKMASYNYAIKFANPGADWKKTTETRCPNPGTDYGRTAETKGPNTGTDCGETPEKDFGPFQFNVEPVSGEETS